MPKNVPVEIAVNTTKLTVFEVTNPALGQCLMIAAPSIERAIVAARQGGIEDICNVRAIDSIDIIAA